MLYPLPLVVLYGYSPDLTEYRHWLAIGAVLVPLVILPRNVVRVVELIAPPRLSAVLESALVAVFSIIHPATVGLVILFGVVVHRCVRWGGPNVATVVGE
jgi:O-antigen/teichoic acid export membrane protein